MRAHRLAFRRYIRVARSDCGRNTLQVYPTYCCFLKAAALQFEKLGDVRLKRLLAADLNLPSQQGKLMMGYA